MATRPDIAQAVGVVAKFCSKPCEAHLTAVKRIFHYLKGTAEFSLIKFMKSVGGELVGYSDGDCAGDVNDRIQQPEISSSWPGGPVSWLSKAEYVALSMATQEAGGFSLVLHQLRLQNQQ